MNPLQNCDAIVIDDVEFYRYTLIIELQKLGLTVTSFVKTEDVIKALRPRRFRLSPLSGPTLTGGNVKLVVADLYDAVLAAPIFDIEGAVAHVKDRVSALRQLMPHVPDADLVIFSIFPHLVAVGSIPTKAATDVYGAIQKSLGLPMDRVVSKNGSGDNPFQAGIDHLTALLKKRLFKGDHDAMVNSNGK
jgi:hypothetical protein